MTIDRLYIDELRENIEFFWNLKIWLLQQIPIDGDHALFECKKSSSMIQLNDSFWGGCF